MSESTAHLLVFPFPAQGHMIPLLHLTHQLATRGLTITILVTPKNLRHLTPLLSAHPHSITPLVLPFPHHPDIPAGVENTIDLPSSGFHAMMCALPGLRDPILHWFRTHPSPPTAIISDMFLGWANHLAADLGIRGYSFFSSGAFAVSFIYSLWRELPQRRNSADDSEMVGFPEIPHSQFYAWWQLPPAFRSYVNGDPDLIKDLEFIRNAYLGSFTGYSLVFNSFDGLEGIYLDYLAKKMGHDRVLSVGPLLPPANVEPKEIGGSNPTLSSKILSWLDTCQDHSVVYICFGSQAVLTNEQMERLTLGLEKSGVKFILSVKGATKGHDDDGNYGSIPEGFEDRVSDRALVIKGWVPQVSILGHKAVCAFLTHCGLNSTLESIVAGVPMLTWPMGADQYLDASLLEEKLDVAVPVCKGPTTVLDSDELAQVLRQVNSEKWSERRARVMALSKAALDAIEVGGSSFKNLDSFAKFLTQN